MTARMLVLLAWIATPLAAQAPSVATPEPSHAAEPVVLTIDAYRESVARVASAIRAEDLETARHEAATLLARRVRSGEGSVETDATILSPVAAAGALDDARERLPALRSLELSLQRAAGRPPRPDGAELARIMRRQGVDAPPEGGDTIDLSLPPLTLSERAKQWLSDLLGGIVELLRDLLEWLYRHFPQGRHGANAFSHMLVVVGTIVVLILAALVVLAVRALRARRGLEVPAPEAEPAAAAAMDADPMSRSARAWEARARELAAAGRLREAVRAWYHGLLVTLYGLGILHYRKGRTNWDYLASLDPRLPWRPDFAELTTSFDHEWYGINATTADDLARFERITRGVMDAALGSRRAGA